MEIKRYTPDCKQAWDAFVESSKNGTFLFKRDYMDYHADRFEDFSLMFFDQKGRILALLPANKKGATLYSHQGLTYGGFILSAKSTVEIVMELFSAVRGFLQKEGFTEVYYKQIPSCYHLCPAEEDEYALWRNRAEMTVCNISATIPLNHSSLTIPFERRRNRGIAKAHELGYETVEATNPDEFWPIMEKNLQEKYGAHPVHSLAEMNMLMERFPENIRCFLAKKNGNAEAGAVIYITQQTVHVQYAHASAEGKSDGALDLLYSELIKKYKDEGFHYFDIGTSNEDGGRVLNENLIAQKEGFGARGITYKQWKFLI